MTNGRFRAVVIGLQNLTGCTQPLPAFRVPQLNVSSWSIAGVHLVEVPSVKPTAGHQCQRQVSGEQIEIL